MVMDRNQTLQQKIDRSGAGINRSKARTKQMAPHTVLDVHASCRVDPGFLQTVGFHQTWVDHKKLHTVLVAGKQTLVIH